MTRFILSVVCVALAQVALCQMASAQNPYGIKLNPGERLISVNGVAVNGATTAPQTVTVQKPVVNQTTSTAGTVTVQKPVVSQPVALSMYHGSDQDRAQAEANYMAANGITGHVGSTIGRFEGCGWSTGGMPPTCTPSSGMTLTADAIAHGRGGVYRVRAWR